jgi:hypothetical protein
MGRFRLDRVCTKHVVYVRRGKSVKGNLTCCCLYIDFQTHLPFASTLRYQGIQDEEGEAVRAPCPYSVVVYGIFAFRSGNTSLEKYINSLDASINIIDTQRLKNI